MNEVITGWNWFLQQSLLVQVFVATGVLNIAIAGLKQLGLTSVANFCLKLENALVAMRKAAQIAFVAELQKPVV